MKESTLSFLGADVFAKGLQNRGQTHKVFDWDKAASIIKEHLIKHPDLIAEAGLQGDWEYTGGVIFKDKQPTSENYTYLSSNWATPTLILSWEDEEQEELDCWTYMENECRFDSSSKWDEGSLAILNSK